MCPQIQLMQYNAVFKTTGNCTKSTVRFCHIFKVKVRWKDFIFRQMHYQIQCMCMPFVFINHLYLPTLTHWGQVTHICVSKLTIIGSDNGLTPGRRQAIIWTSAVILLIRNLGTNFSEIVIEIQTFSLKKMRLKMSSAKMQPLCLGLNLLTVSWNTSDESIYSVLSYHSHLLLIYGDNKLVSL